MVGRHLPVSEALVGLWARAVVAEPLLDGDALVRVAIGADDGVAHHLVRDGAAERLGRLLHRRVVLGDVHGWPLALARALDVWCASSSSGAAYIGGRESTRGCAESSGVW